MSEISNFWLSVLISHMALYLDFHTCVKVYISCQFGVFFKKCTMLLHTYPLNYEKRY